MDECSICLDELVGSIVILECKHKYHDICIGTWYESNINFVCPQCNLVTDIETIINIEPDPKNNNNIEMIPHFTDNKNVDSDNQSGMYTPLTMVTINNDNPITITNAEQEIENDEMVISKKKCIRCCIS